VKRIEDSTKKKHFFAKVRLSWVDCLLPHSPTAPLRQRKAKSRRLFSDSNCCREVYNPAFEILAGKSIYAMFFILAERKSN